MIMVDKCDFDVFLSNCSNVIFREVLYEQQVVQSDSTFFQ